MLILLVAPIWIAIYAIATVWGLSTPWLYTIGILGAVTSFLAALLSDQ